jgi:hypothetical protein
MKLTRMTVETNRIDLFQRVPSDLRRYRNYIYKLQKEHGSVMNFILLHRLQWLDITPSGKPFENLSDIKIVYNDWPYGIDSRIVHLVVWTKFVLEDDAHTGHLTVQSRQQVNQYVDRTFCSRVDPQNVRCVMS